MVCTEAIGGGAIMSRFTERLKKLVHWPERTKTPAEHKQESRWEGEGGALHPDDDEQHD